MKIKLIFPKGQYHNFWDPRTSVLLSGKRYSSIPLSLPTLAALCPVHDEVEIIDENIDDIDFERPADLVAISFFTAFAVRAYEIADEFRRRGVKVVLGGIHASALPDEGLAHADSVMIGEAEDVWPQIVEDCRNNKLKSKYQSAEKPDLQKLVIPRWDLLDVKKYNFFTIQSTRGCPFNCEFCSVSNFFGRGFRTKPIDNVIQEIKYLKKLVGNKTIVFADDNFIGNPKYAKELIIKLIENGINNWWCQASINLSNEDELLNLMAKSGCKQVFIGFESLSEESLTLMNKKVNLAHDFLKSVSKIHSYGISVFGSFIVGYDGDGKDVFKKTVDFINTSKIAFALVGLLVPFPDTPLYKRLEKEERLVCRDWDKYNGEHVCFLPKKMDAEELEEGHRWVLKNIYSYNSLYNRLDNLWDRGVLIKKDGMGPLKNISLKKLAVISKALFNKDFREDKNRVKFLLRSIFHKNNPRFFSIFSAIDFHDVVEEYLHDNNDKF